MVQRAFRLESGTEANHEILAHNNSFESYGNARHRLQSTEARLLNADADPPVGGNHRSSSQASADGRSECAVRFEAAQTLILDSAMGTELARRGVAVPSPLWSAAALLTHPELVGQIHAENVAAGADILVANTFRTNPRTLRKAGLGNRWCELTTQAVELTRSAAASAGRRVIVAASVAPVEDCYRPNLTPSDEQLRSEHGLFADQIARSGVDMIWIETMGTAREALAAAQAARSAGLDFAISYVLAEGGTLLGGDGLPAAIAAILPLKPVAIGLNCIPPAGLTRNLGTLAVSLQREFSAAGATRPAIAAYGHIGNTAPIPGWSVAEDCCPEVYLNHVRDWLRAGASVIGGCCGTTPAHIRQICAALNSPTHS